MLLDAPDTLDKLASKVQEVEQRLALERQKTLDWILSVCMEIPQ